LAVDQKRNGLVVSLTRDSEYMVTLTDDRSAGNVEVGSPALLDRALPGDDGRRSFPVFSRSSLLRPVRLGNPEVRSSSTVDAPAFYPKPAAPTVSVSPAETRWWTILPYVLGASSGLGLAALWLAPHSPWIRLGLALGVAGLLALAMWRHALAMTNVTGTTLSNSALSLANQQLTSMNEHLQLVATTDPLTGLPNRTLLQESLLKALRPGPGGVPLLALLLLDLDRFKQVNDTLGHHAGDLLLQQVTTRLQEALAGAGSLIRLGGDEFAVVLPGLDADGAEELAQRCARIFTAPFLLDGHALRVGGSIGVALAPDHGQDANMLLRCADVAMYVAKRRHSGHAIYAPAEDHHSPRLLQLAGGLQQAILQEGLCLYYQPKVRLETGKVCGVEALVRWRHPEHGLIAPDQFIPLAEETGLIGPLTQWVLNRALLDCQKWKASGLNLPIAVNLSMRNVQDPVMPELVSRLLAETAVPPGMLTLEITESLLMADPAAALEVLSRLSSLGLRLAIDDFGTGHSALGYLKQLPVNELKIDKAFVLNLSAPGTGGMRTDRMIVRSVTALAHALGLDVVAEGVENQSTYELLGTMRCNVVQGYYVSRPLPATEVERWVRTTAFAPIKNSVA
jgi:diguanylate cyclase (GGDEF)-like protein